MFFFDCEKGFVPDSGEDTVTDGSVENFDTNWNVAETEQNEREQAAES